MVSINLQPEQHPLFAIDFTTSSNESFVIEASAGTGKTWTIERLYIKALLERSDLDISKILVVTFTNAATAELKSRILKQIKLTLDCLVLYIANGSNSEQDITDDFIRYLIVNRAHDLNKDIQVLLRSAQSFDHASIYTIHGFCNNVLKDYAIECGISPQFKLVPNYNSHILQLTRDFLRKFIISNPLYANHIEQVYAYLAKVLATSNPLLRNTLDYAESLVYKLPNDLLIRNKLGFSLKYKVIDNPDLSLLTTSAEQASITDIAANLYSALCLYLEENLLDIVVAHNEVSYNDLISLVAFNIDDLSHNLCADYPLAFIDEFQDTDYLQWKIFSNIYGVNAKNSKKASTHKVSAFGSLIVVGDPKQAIYRFRGADLNVYLQATKSIQHRLALIQNRRSHPDIISFINNLFNDKVNPECFGRGINYYPIQALVDCDKLIDFSKSKTPKHSAQVVLIKGATAPQRNQNLLNSITKEILTLLTEDPSLISKIAILVCRNDQANQLVEHLRKFDIPACELRLGNIFATATALDLYKILSSCADLANRNLFMAALSSKLLGINYQALMFMQENNFGWYEQINLTQCFFDYKMLWENKGIISLVYKLVEDLYLIHKISNTSVTKRQLSDLFQLGELLHKFSLTTNNILELLYWYKQKIIDATTNSYVDNLNIDEEEVIRLDDDSNQITITTQHKSKGLEYDILFCPYFKSDATIQGYGSSSGYSLPMFATYNGKSALITDAKLAQEYLAEENKEIHRLNYVTLTRAKSRIYIYLKQPTLTRSGAYHSAAKPEKINELFGFSRDALIEKSHPLFNFRALFNDIGNAIKNDSLWLNEGACFYESNVSKDDLEQSLYSYKQKMLELNNELKFNLTPSSTDGAFDDDSPSDYNHELPPWSGNIDKISQIKYRQSYTMLAHKSKNDAADVMVDLGFINGKRSENFIENEVKELDAPNYRFRVFNDLGGATFGNLIHNLCENYPLSLDSISLIMSQYNINLDYLEELYAIINEIFNYRFYYLEVLHKNSMGICLSTIPNKIYELEFNLSIKTKLDLSYDLTKMLAKHYGAEHFYTKSCSRLGYLNQGYLHGFIDVVFEYNGLYYVLDYKTNRLDSYTGCTKLNDFDNPLLQENANNHYYLQYLLYMVALKRYLEIKLGIEDATALLGGVIYYYIRGIFTIDNPLQENITRGDLGLYYDVECQPLVAQIDELLR